MVAADLVFRVTSQTPSVLWGIDPFTVIHDECFFYFGVKYQLRDVLDKTNIAGCSDQRSVSQLLS